MPGLPPRVYAVPLEALGKSSDEGTQDMLAGMFSALAAQYGIAPAASLAVLGPHRATVLRALLANLTGEAHVTEQVRAAVLEGVAAIYALLGPEPKAVLSVTLRFGLDSLHARSCAGTPRTPRGGPNTPRSPVRPIHAQTPRSGVSAQTPRSGSSPRRTDSLRTPRQTPRTPRTPRQRGTYLKGFGPLNGVQFKIALGEISMLHRVSARAA
jgi:hypothetical protein